MPNELSSNALSSCGAQARERLANEPLVSEMHLYLLPLAPINSSQRALLLKCLSDDEQAKVGRYQPKSRNNALIVRAALRHVLSLHTPSHGRLLPDEWQFEYGKQGKPELTAAQYAQTGINFNLSHSGDWLLIGVLQAPAHGKRYALGVDIERRRDSTNIHTILKRYFAEAEITDLLALDASKQRHRFFDLWALKESYIKACGKGLAMKLTRFSFDINAARQRQNSDNTASTNSNSQEPKIHRLSLDGLFSFSSAESGVNPGPSGFNSAESGVMSVNFPEPVTPESVTADIDYSPAQQAVMTRINQAQSGHYGLAESPLTKGLQLDWLSVPLQHSQDQELEQELEQAGSSEKADNSWHSYLAQLDEQYRIGVSVSL
ncbi:4'-phosphopantetheinyl transferase family protein [Shewanella sp.]|uniref:4'-phosphopantetheinyl transferase family protein n=1 Tax=Shewanella sp. TaxID=50422 RepID=UPI004053FB74